MWHGLAGPEPFQVGFSPLFFAIFNRKMQKLPLLSCISIMNKGKTAQIAIDQPRFWVYFDPNWDWKTALTYENYAAFL